MKRFAYMLLLCIGLPSFLASQIISPDLSFGTDGFIEYPVPSGYFASAMEVYSDEGIVLAMEDSGFGNPHFRAVRFLPNGETDTGFGTDGVINFNAGNDFDYAYVRDVAVLEDGTLLFLLDNSYHDYFSNHSNLLIHAFNTDGTYRFFKNIDLTDESGDYFYSIEPYGNNNFRVAGRYYDPDFFGWYVPNDNLSIKSYTSTGSDAGSSSDYSMDATARHTADLPGSAYLIAGSIGGSGAVIRNTGYSSYDPTFGDHGLAVKAGDNLTKVFVKADGKILTYGEGKIYQLLPNGKPDVHFADNGVLDLGPYGNPAEDLIQLADGGFLFANGSNIYQFLPNGSLNPAFGDNGVYSPSYNGNPLQIRQYQLVNDTTFIVYHASNGIMVVGRYQLDQPTADIGVLQISSPTSSNTLTEMETITVQVRNYGTETQSGFELGYQVNGQPAVVEFLDVPIAPGETYEHSFATGADLSTLGNYQLTAFTSLGGDAYPSNDT
ncbi:MAG: hypothetical protein KDC44_05595, partial [Phaeodactylibacter sp.]|nr:hypothetical protein [Phaeodactylibacter sp.]